MLLEMTDRGPDSAGFAIYRDGVAQGQVKLTVLAPDSFSWPDFEAALNNAFNHIIALTVTANHAVITAEVDGSTLRTGWVILA